MNKKYEKVLSTRNSLLMSIISLILCFAMLIGTTYAWFTDEVTSGVNQIKAGNLDVELWHTSKSVTTATEIKNNDANLLFKDVALWEPGAYAYETFTVKNVGTLALKYKMALNVAAFTSYAGHDLTEVLKVATLNSVPTSRADITGGVALKDWSLSSDNVALYPVGNIPGNGASEKTFTVAIYWEPTDHDNDFNMNNGRPQPLSVDLGVQLVATQLEYENDSFDNTYDHDADNTLDPAAKAETALASAVVVANQPTVFTTKNTPSGESGKITTVTVPAEEASFVANSTSTLKVETTPTVAANNKFTVGNGTDGAVGAIDLEVKVNDVVVSQFKDGSGDPVTVKVETYVAKNLTNVTFAYGGTNWTQVATEAEVEANKFFYDKESGQLVFGTTHFSTFVLGADEVAYVEETNMAYKTFEEAIDAANGKEISLIKDIKHPSKDGITIAKEQTVDLDLNGKTLSVDCGTTGNTYVLKNKGTLTINDSSSDKKGTITINGNPGYRSDHVLYLEGGSTTTINGGRIVTGGYYPVYVVQATEATGKTTFTMNDGYISGGWYGLYLNGGNSETSALDATVNGGTIKTTFLVNHCRNWYKSKYDFNVSPPAETLLYYTKEYEAIGIPVQTYYFANLTIKNANVGYDAPTVSDEYIDEKLAEAEPLSDYYINTFGQQPTTENTRKVITISCNPIEVNVDSQVAKISITNTTLNSYTRKNETITTDSKTVYDPADYHDEFAESYPGTTQNGDVWIIKK